MQGNKIIEEITGSNTLHYIYDAEGSVVAFKYYEDTYYYKRNVTGDVIGIMDEAGTEVVTYKYNSWGELESITDTSQNNIGEINPIRYKGYYYDSESKLYYLNSRYYNPETKRMLNADGILGQQGNIIGHNMYAYAGNNPIMYIDPSGYSIWSWMKKVSDTAKDIILAPLRLLTNAASRIANKVIGVKNGGDMTDSANAYQNALLGDGKTKKHSKGDSLYNSIVNSQEYVDLQTRIVGLGMITGQTVNKSDLYDLSSENLEFNSTTNLLYAVDGVQELSVTYDGEGYDIIIRDLYDFGYWTLEDHALSRTTIFANNYGGYYPQSIGFIEPYYNEIYIRYAH